MINPKNRLKDKMVLMQIGGSHCWNTYEHQIARWIEKPADKHSSTPGWRVSCTSAR
jgi:hypothetical protein